MDDSENVVSLGEKTGAKENYSLLLTDLVSQVSPRDLSSEAKKDLERSLDALFADAGSDKRKWELSHAALERLDYPGRRNEPYREFCLSGNEKTWAVALQALSSKFSKKEGGFDHEAFVYWATLESLRGALSDRKKPPAGFPNLLYLSRRTGLIDESDFGKIKNNLALLGEIWWRYSGEHNEAGLNFEGEYVKKDPQVQSRLRVNKLSEGIKQLAEETTYPASLTKRSDQFGVEKVPDSIGATKSEVEGFVDNFKDNLPAEK